MTERANISTAPACLNTNDKAMWVTGWNDCLDAKAPVYTTGHCKNKAQPGGCQLHNLQCGYPECDRAVAVFPFVPWSKEAEMRESWGKTEALHNGHDAKHWNALAVMRHKEIQELEREIERKNELLRRAALLCEWIAETPHQRGSINGQATQVGYAIAQELK